MRFDIGDNLTLKAKATKTEDGKPVDPEGCYWKVVPVGGKVEDVEVVSVTKVESGYYKGRYTPTISGKHLVLFHGRGENGAAEETEFFVNKPVVPREPAP